MEPETGIPPDLVGDGDAIPSSNLLPANKVEGMERASLEHLAVPVRWQESGWEGTPNGPLVPDDQRPLPTNSSPTQSGGKFQSPALHNDGGFEIVGSGSLMVIETQSLSSFFLFQDQNINSDRPPSQEASDQASAIQSHNAYLLEAPDLDLLDGLLPESLADQRSAENRPYGDPNPLAPSETEATSNDLALLAEPLFTGTIPASSDTAQPERADFSTTGRKWAGKSPIVTWSFANQGSAFDQVMADDYQEIFKNAFDAWAEVSNIEFIAVNLEESGQAQDKDSDIVISLGNTDPFLAFAYFPPNGNIVFDQHVNWTNESLLNRGALHEIGHAIGLNHESLRPAIMDPVISSGFNALTVDDIAGARAIYGKDTNGGAPLTGLTYNMPDRLTDLALNQKVEAARGTNDIRINGNNKSNVIEANGGENYLTGGDGDDLLRGFRGSDDLHGNDGADRLFGGGGDDLLRGNAGDDFLDGGNGQDQAIAGSGRDTLRGQGGNDELRGGADRDSLFGGDGDDKLFGGGQNDKLNGGKGDDILLGQDGNDRLTAGGGRDKINGGSGDDSLKGGGSGDTFIFNQDSGHDRVSDFLTANDLLKVTDYGFASSADVLAATRNSGGNAVIDLGNGNSITLEGVLKSDLNADNFIV